MLSNTSASEMAPSQKTESRGTSRSPGREVTSTRVPANFDFGEIGANLHQFLLIYGGQVALVPCGDFQDQFAVEVHVVAAFVIRHLRDDTLAFVHGGVPESQTVFADGQFVAFLVLEQGTGVVVRSTVDTSVDGFGDVVGEDIEAGSRSCG